MTDEQADKIIYSLEAKIELMQSQLDVLTREVLPVIETLGEAVVFRKKEADEIFHINKQTLSKSTNAETFEEIGARRVYVNLRSVSVYRAKNRKKK